MPNSLGWTIVWWFFFSSRRRHTRFDCDWSSDVCSSDLGLALYLASGTDEPYVRQEAQLLDVTRYFGKHIYGAVDDYKKFSKKMVIERIRSEERRVGKKGRSRWSPNH